jgi:long-chain acyl-CoA synthetase
VSVNALWTAIDETARARPADPALIVAADESRITYSELRNATLRLAAVLPDEGSVVSVVAARRDMQAVAILAGLAAGCLVNPVAADLPAQRRETFLADAAPDLVLDDGDLDTLLMSPAPGGAAPSGAASGLLIYTSGTTGAAKGVELLWPRIEANVRYASSVLGYASRWITGSILPLTHTFTLISDVLPMILSGGSVLITDTFDIRRAEGIVDAFARYRVRSFSAVPIIFEALTAFAGTMGDIEFAVAGAAPLRENVRIRYGEHFGHPIIPCYGLTETTCFATISPINAVRTGSVGKPAGIELATIEASREEEPRRFDEVLPTGETGEIIVRGPSVVRSYFRGGHADAFSSSGWFATGDIGRIDSDSYVYVTGRRKSMIIRGGEKTYLDDVDRILATHERVRDCCTIPLIEPTGERAASIVVSSGVDAIALARHVEAGLGRSHVPDDFVFVDEIPRTITGKPRMDLLRALAAGRVIHD